MPRRVEVFISWKNEDSSYAFGTSYVIVKTDKYRVFCPDLDSREGEIGLAEELIKADERTNGGQSITPEWIDFYLIEDEVTINLIKNSLKWEEDLHSMLELL